MHKTLAYRNISIMYTLRSWHAAKGVDAETFLCAMADCPASVDVAESTTRACFQWRQLLWEKWQLVYEQAINAICPAESGKRTLRPLVIKQGRHQRSRLNSHVRW